MTYARTTKRLFNKNSSICPLCKGKQTAQFQEVENYYYYKCSECSFVYLDPMPSEMILESTYNTGGEITEDYFPKSNSRLRRAMRIAMHLYRFAWRGPILDLGCGGGFQVEAFRRFGMCPTGLDIGKPSIAYARQSFGRSQFYCESLEEFSTKKLKFKLIFSAEVIEHVINLSNYMDFINYHLLDGGYVYITTPDIGSPLVPDNVLEWDVFSPPRHVQFFQSDNLTRLFRNYGFKVKKRFRGPKAGLRYLFQKI